MVGTRQGHIWVYEDTGAHGLLRGRRHGASTCAELLWVELLWVVQNSYPHLVPVRLLSNELVCGSCVGCGPETRCFIAGNLNLQVVGCVALEADLECLFLRSFPGKVYSPPPCPERFLGQLRPSDVALGKFWAQTVGKWQLP